MSDRPIPNVETGGRQVGSPLPLPARLPGSGEEGPRRVLVVEDDVAQRRLLEHIVSRRGHTVTSCGDAEAAWAAYRQKPFPLVLLDWMLPGADGLEVCQKIREMPEGDMSIILIITARDKPEDLEKVLAVGADDYIAKPIDHKLINVRLAVAEKRVRDVAERKRLQAQVLHSQKLESLGVLAGGIAHDFNNLLMGVQGHAGLALAETSPELPVYESLKQIETISIRAADLTRQMLAYSGKGPFLVELLDLTVVVEEMADLLEVAISKKATIQKQLDIDLPPIEADSSQVRQVIMNLITNASDALGEASGYIRLRTGVIDANRDYLKSAYVDDQLPAGKYVYVEVADNGQGMSRQTMAKIFDPFFSTKFTGRGLGLAAVLGIVRAHHGTIRVESAEGQGTTFRVLFPIHADAEKAPLEMPPEWNTSQLVGTVLVVDDEDDVRWIVRRMLESFGLSVVEAVNGREAVDIYRERGSELTGVLLDLTMPEMSGEEALAEILEMNPSARVILSSGYSARTSQGPTDPRQHAGFIQKPYQPQALLAKLREILTPGDPS